MFNNDNCLYEKCADGHFFLLGVIIDEYILYVALYSEHSVVVKYSTILKDRISPITGKSILLHSTILCQFLSFAEGHDN